MPRNTTAPPARAELPSSGNGHAPHIDADRMDRIEALLSGIQQQLNVQFQRIADLQIQIDRAISSDRLKPNR